MAALAISRRSRTVVLLAIIAGVVAAVQVPVFGAPGETAIPPLRKYKAVDADNHNVLINRPGVITLLLGTGEDSQDAARLAGKAVYPFQGRPDFQLMVVVDLRDSVAAWVPSIVLAQMRSNLDHEAIELKPFFLKNGNKGNPRNSSHVIADFSGTICPQLGWTENAEDLRGILFGADGREIQRWDKIDDMDKLQNDVRAAIRRLVDARQARAAAVVRAGGTKLIQPPNPGPPLPPAPTPGASH